MPNRYFCLFFGILCSGCASILSGNKQSVSVDTQVEKTEVYLNQKFIGETPVTFEILKEKNVILELRKNGYKTKKVKLTSKIDPYFWLNLPLPVLGTTGLSTDYGTGSIYEYKPSHFLIEMLPARDSKTKPEALKRLLEQRLYGLTNLEQITNEKSRSQWGEVRSTEQFLKMR